MIKQLTIISLFLIGMSYIPVAHSLYLSELEKMINDVHKKVFQEEIVITDSFRTARSQAILFREAWDVGKDLHKLYRDHRLLNELYDAYMKEAGDCGDTKEFCKVMTPEDNITWVIALQMKRGDYISKHLCLKAVDIRSRGKTLKQIQIFFNVLHEAYPGILKTINEHNHVHIELTEVCNG